MIYTPGLAGTAQSLDPGSGDLRAAEVSTAELETALANQDVEPQQTIEITGAYEVPDGGGQTRSTATGEPAIVLEVPGPGTGLGQVVLAQDESGVVTWNLPHDAQGEGAASRGADTLTYVIRRYVPAQADGDTETRGLLGAVGKKLLKVLVFPLVDPLIEKGRSRSPRRGRRASARTAAAASSPAITATRPGRRSPATAGANWPASAGCCSSTARSAGHTPLRRAAADLSRRWTNATPAAWSRSTTSRCPMTRWSTSTAHGDAARRRRLDVDVVAHSRGGLVARMLAERGAEICGRTLDGADRACRLRRHAEQRARCSPTPTTWRPDRPYSNL